MKKRLSLLLLVSLLSVITSANAGVNDALKESELQNYIERQTKISFDDYLKAKGTVSNPEWEQVLRTIFTRLTYYSGENAFSATLAIVNDSSFNAICFGGGQFAVNTGALQFFDDVINRRSDRATLDLQRERELLMAPVIAHELGHFYNRHYYKVLKKFMEFTKGKESNFTVEQLQYSLLNEYEADYTGWLLLQKSGYNPETMALLLEMLNAMQQAAMDKTASIGFNQYFITHPSPHKRLAKIQNSRQQYHKTAAEMEQVFDDVQIGINLERSIDFLDKAIKDNPGNLYLKKERVIALHKLWLTTVPLSEQQLRGIIDAPSFRDEMLGGKGTRAQGAKIPGNEAYYKKAMEAYLVIANELGEYGLAADYGFASNLALLMIYSPDEKERAAAVQIAAYCAKTGDTLPLYSNCAVVMYLYGEKATAINILGQLAAIYDSRYQAVRSNAQSDSSYMAFLQEMQKNLAVAEKLNKNYVLDDFTPLLNYSLMLYYSGDKAGAKAVAQKYLAEYENKSEWAAYISKMTDVKIPAAAAKKYIAFHGIKVKDSIQTVVSNWGKADRIFTIEQGEERWYYDKNGVSLSIMSGVVMMIILESPDGGKLDNGIIVGSSRKQIEKIAGKHTSERGGYYIYEGPQNMAVVYSNDIAAMVILFQ